MLLFLPCHDSRATHSMASALAISGIPQENLIRFGVFPQQIALLGTAFTNLVKRTTAVPADDNDLAELRSVTKFLASCTQHAQSVRRAFDARTYR